jgi:hypothetical protein
MARKLNMAAFELKEEVLRNEFSNLGIPYLSLSSEVGSSSMPRSSLI